jgi:hypothetical protein
MALAPTVVTATNIVATKTWERWKGTAGKTLVGLRYEDEDSLTEKPLDIDTHSFRILEPATLVEIPGCEFFKASDAAAARLATLHTVPAASAGWLRIFIPAKQADTDPDYIINRDSFKLILESRPKAGRVNDIVFRAEIVGVAKWPI